MTLDILCDMLELPTEVADSVKEYQKSHISILDEKIKQELKKWESWDAAVEELKARIGEEKSFASYRKFLKNYYPEWENINWHCESWMLSPVLEGLLPEESHILRFQHLFDITAVDYDSMAVLDWVYPGEKGDFADLSEKTSLQRNMKTFLQAGGKVGWAKGILKN